MANGADVDTVIVNGQILMQGRQLTSVNEESVLNEAQAATEIMLDRTGRRALTNIPEGFFGATRY